LVSFGGQNSNLSFRLTYTTRNARYSAEQKRKTGNRFVFLQHNQAKTGTRNPYKIHADNLPHGGDLGELFPDI
jgi:hypothetical protein